MRQRRITHLEDEKRDVTKKDEGKSERETERREGERSEGEREREERDRREREERDESKDCLSCSKTQKKEKRPLAYEKVKAQSTCTPKTHGLTLRA